MKRGSAVLVQESLPVLYSLLAMLRQNPNLKIRLEGHVCCITYTEGGAYQWGITLSYARARAVHDFLLQNNIDSGRLSFTGMGNKHPLTINGFTDLSDFRNRRVEVRIIEK